MLTRVLLVTIAALLTIAISERTTIAELRAEVLRAQARAVIDARAIAADSMGGDVAEVKRTLVWLNALYSERDGLQRPNGLWIDGHPDYEAISAWVFDVYLRRRMKDEPEDRIRADIYGTIQQSAEYRSKHPR